MVRHFTKLMELGRDEAHGLISLALALKQDGPLSHRSMRFTV